MVNSGRVGGRFLNLGCGNDVRPGWENFDKYPVNDKVKFIDLSVLPFPFPDGYADFILLHHVFEHLSVNRFELMKELSRILKPGGEVRIVVPILKPNVEHEKLFFTSNFFNNLKIDLYGSLFKDIRVVCTRNRLRDIFWKIKYFLFWIFTKEVKYELTK